MTKNFNLETETEELVLRETAVDNDNTLVVYNDDVNTFDHVIGALVDICEHNSIQAEQCTMIIHYNGKCTVKTGVYQKLETMCGKILERGITAEIQ